MSAKLLPDPEYLRQRLRYDPSSGKLFWLPKSIDVNGWNKKYSGREAFTAKMRNGYLTGAVDSKNYLAHRIAWAVYYGKEPNGEVDHIDHNRANNCITNLREVSRTENCRNMSAYSTRTSGITGVHWYPMRQKWKAEIWVNYKKICLGYFSDINDAAKARSQAERKYSFHANHGI